jgi:hypothetical protein
MTELEWLKQESGLSDDELKAMEAVAGHTKFVGMLQKIMGQNEAAKTAQQTAETERLAFEKRYNDEFIPEMRKVTTDAMRAAGENAKLQAQLKKAQEYGIVPDDPAPVVVDQPRAPGSPDPNVVTRDDFGRYSNAQASAMITLNDLNAEHFKLYGAPLGESQALLDEVQRQRTLGHKDFNLRNAWETKYNVQAKRAELSAAERQKDIDTAVAAKLKEERQKNGDNPHVRSGQPSRFSTYKPSDGNGAKEPWKTPAGQRTASMKPWREKAVAAVRDSAA